VKLTKIVHPPKILDFDIENRPLSYWFDGQCTSEITAISMGWADDEGVETCVLVHEDMESERTVRRAMLRMLEGFRSYYNHADIVTGHFIRKHDLPIINAAMVEYGLKMLAPKMTIDTKLDLYRFGGLPKSQQALGTMLSRYDEAKSWKYLGAKEAMSDPLWRTANRLTQEGVKETVRRVEGDVKQHRELRVALSEHGYLKGGKEWRP
jgi:hypothetical protein